MVVEQDVARLDVPVDEALPVGVGQGLGDLGHQADGFVVGGRLLAMRSARLPPSIELGHDEAGAPSRPTSKTGTTPGCFNPATLGPRP